jgi:hypothetical protein
MGARRGFLVRSAAVPVALLAVPVLAAAAWAGDLSGWPAAVASLGCE